MTGEWEWEWAPAVWACWTTLMLWMLDEKLWAAAELGNKKKRQRKQIKQKRVKKAINKTSIDDGDSKAICWVRVSPGRGQGERGRSSRR